MAFKDEFLGDFFLDKKDPPADAIPGTFCHFPIFKIYPKCDKIINYMMSSSIADSIKLFDMLYSKQQQMLIDQWSDIKEYEELKES